MSDADVAGRTKPHVRARVLRAALEAFEEQGPDRVRVQDIAARAGMSSGHVLYYFGDRDRIVTSTLLLSEENLAERRDRAVARAASPAEGVHQVMRLYLPVGPRDVRWALWAQAIARPTEDAAVREQLRAAADGWADCLAALLSAMRPAGRARRDDAATAYRLCRLMDGLAMEVLLGSPGRGRAWAMREAESALDALLG